MKKNYENYYNIRLEYELGSKNPAHLFNSMSNAIEAFKKIDIMLARSISKNVTTEQTLEGLEIGSIFTKVKNAIEYTNDEQLEEINAEEIPVLKYLNKSKEKIIENVNHTDEIDNVDQIDSIIIDIGEIAKDTGVDKIFHYSPPQQNEVIDTVEKIVEMSKDLNPEEKIKFSSDNNSEELEISKNTKLNINKIDDSRISKILENQRDMILKIKKVDFLGESQWDFKHGKTAIKAKIEDYDWMNKFHKKGISFSPGDSLLAYTNIREEYDKFGTLIAEEHIILKVKEIIPGELE